MKKIILISFFLIAILSLTSVSASDNMTDTMAVGETDSLALEDASDLVSENNSRKDLDVDIINLNEEYFKYDSGEYYISMDHPSNFNGSFEAYVDNVKNPNYNFWNNNYYTYLAPSSFEVGMHNLTLVFNGDEIYNPLNVTKQFSIVKTLIEVPSGELSSSYAYVSVQKASDATGYLSIFADSKLIKKVDVSTFKTRFYHSFELPYGTHTIEVNYTGDGKYAKASKKSTFKLNYITLEDSHAQYNGEGIRVSFGEDSSAPQKNIIAEIEGEKRNVTFKDGYFYVDIINLTLGWHNITITYPGDGKYPESTINGRFEIYSQVAWQYSTPYGDPINLTLMLPPKANGNFTLYLSNERITSQNPGTLYESKALVNGVGQIQLNLPVGIYYYNAVYTGKDYDVRESNFCFAVDPKVIIPSTMTYGEDKYAEITADGNANGSFGITTMDRKFKFTTQLINGSGRISLKNMPVGYYDLECFYYENTTEHQIFGNTITVKGLQCRLVGGRDITMYYEGGNVYSLKVWGDYGKVVGAYEEVKVKIGKQSYVVQTDKNGVARLKIEQLPGRYTITATYHNAKATNRLVVKSMLSLYVVKVKKSAKKVILTAKLAKRLKGKIITFKFNGKILKTRTNAYGIAKVTVSKTLLSKLMVGRTVTYSATYVEQTVKRTARVLR